MTAGFKIKAVTIPERDIQKRQKGEVITMRVNYKGRDKNYNYRIAELNCEEEEFEDAVKMADLMEKRGWKCSGFCDCWCCWEVDDIDDYKYNFMYDWKECKKECRAMKKTCKKRTGS